MAKNDFRVPSVFKIIIRICMKNVEFCGKTSKSLPKRCLFIFYVFCLNERELNQQVCLIKYEEKKQREEKNHYPTSKTFLFSISKIPEKISLVTLVTNYHKLSLLPLVVRSWRKFEKQKLVLNFESCYCYFKWVIFS